MGWASGELPRQLRWVPRQNLKTNLPKTFETYHENFCYAICALISIPEASDTRSFCQSKHTSRDIRCIKVVIWEMCQCNGACFLDVGGKISWVRDTIKRISREYAGNVPGVMVTYFGMCGKVSWVRETFERISRDCAGNVPVSWCLRFGCGWVNRGYGRQLREYLENRRGMCQCHGACVLDVVGKTSLVR
jgi:hypothetical protein